MEKLKHYKIIEKIGSGGMGTVYHAFDTQLERDVAIKLMHPAISQDEQNAKRLMREARAAAKLVHPNVVTIYEVGESEQGRFIVMEYVNGIPLTTLILLLGNTKTGFPFLAKQSTVYSSPGKYSITNNSGNFTFRKLFANSSKV